MMIDISNFYLMTPLKQPEYIRIHIKDIPVEIIAEYKLKENAEANGAVYIVANRGMYCFLQSVLLAKELLEKLHNKCGYHQMKLVPGLWKHKLRPLQFTLVVEIFEVKYVGGEHALHLKQTLEENYTFTTEWYRKRYIFVTLYWYCKQRQLHISLPGCIKKAIN